jgi:hypothetical protein
MGTPLATSFANGKSSMRDGCCVSAARSLTLQSLRWNLSDLSWCIDMIDIFLEFYFQ